MTMIHRCDQCATIADDNTGWLRLTPVRPMKDRLDFSFVKDTKEFCTAGCVGDYALGLEQKAAADRLTS